MGKKVYTVSFKDDACKLVADDGHAPAIAAKKLGVAEMTLRSWLTARGWVGPRQSQRAEPCDDPKILNARIRELERKLRESEIDKEILKKSDGLLREPEVKRFVFVKENCRVWPVARMCRMLQVTRGGYYAWRDRPASDREKRRVQWIGKITLAYEQSRRTYGSPRVHAQLVKEGESINVKTVAKLMKQAEICVKPKKAFVPRTTQADPSHQTFANVLDRHFAAEEPNRKWTGDITYIPTREGWMYLAVILDLFSRRVVGWATSDRLETRLVSEALASALVQRRPGSGLLHHSDRGCQYTSEDYQRLLREMRIQPSMSDPGQCWDNAVSESFFGTLKTELVNQQTYATHREAHGSLFEWIECWYNRQRLHSSLGYQSPEQFEAQFN